MKLFIWSLAAFLNLVFGIVFAQYPCEMIVSASVANLVAQPGFDHQEKRGPVLSKNVPKLDTQLIAGQRVNVLEEFLVGEEVWVKVEALEQKKAIFDIAGKLEAFTPYPGWMRKKDLNKCAQNKKIDLKNITNKSDFLLDENARAGAVHYARSFLGSPYVWGGCSEYRSQAGHLTGVDCSGLIYLSYRNSTLEVPRDAHDQFCWMHEIDSERVQPGDLVFFGVQRECNGNIHMCVYHVLMYVGNGLLIEAFAGNPSCSDTADLTEAQRALACVREISFEERLGKSLHELSNGDFLQKTKCFIFFRSVFSPTQH